MATTDTNGAVRLHAVTAGAGRPLVPGPDVSGAVLAGWSWGAEVALAALPALRQRVAGLALLSATPRFTAGEGWPHGLAESRVRALRARLARGAAAARRALL